MQIIHIFLSKGTFKDVQEDKLLLDIFKSQLKPDLNSVYFLHTIGSHPSFVISESISCYIESIKRTDAFIGEIYKILQKTGQKFQIVYFSDHGLKITESNDLLHHDDYKQNYEIPLIIIDSELKENVYYNE